MHDCLRPDLDELEDLDGVTPPIFRRVFTAGEDEASTYDADALASELVPRPEPIGRREAADLIVLGSAGAAPGRTSLGPDGREALEGACRPVAVAPRGFAADPAHGMRRIAVGIDGSREAAAALALAGRIARRHDSTLRAIAVAEMRDLGGAARPVDPRERERLARHLAAAAADLPGVAVRTELREGLPDQILLDLAREADLLVLGSRASYGSAGRVALGTVAERVLRASPCPALVVPAP